ncbi:MAG: glycosyltransferase family 2 protein [Firmicutes bacterium]|nr:glycosyltransferase family 2 protein [Bacillota bacterium]
MENVQISIIVPVYNVEDYIVKMAKSLVLQEFDEVLGGFEVILVDDGCLDKSIEVAVDILQGIDVTVLKQANTGPGGARNSGIRAAKGEYLMFVDSDDFLLEGSLQKIFQLIKSQNPVIIFGRYLRWTENVGFLDNPPKLGENLQSDELEMSTEKTSPITIEYILDVFPELSWNSAWRYICKREFILQNSLFFNDTMYCEDMKWVLEILQTAENQAVKFSFLQQPFYVYNYRRPNSIMNAHSPKRLIDLNIIMEEFLQIHCKRPKICRKLIWQSFYYINEYCQFDKNNRKLIFCQYKKVLPFYKLSEHFVYTLAGKMNAPPLFYLLSVVLAIIKNVRRALIGLRGTNTTPR